MSLVREEFAQLASTRDGESREVTENVRATANFRAKMLLTTRTLEIDQPALSDKIKKISGLINRFSCWSFGTLIICRKIIRNSC